MKFRNSIDRWIFNNILLKDEYQLRRFLLPGDVVLDIGAHAGYFTYAALAHKAKKVYAYEMTKENYLLAKENLQDYSDSVVLENKAIWRSDTNEKTKTYYDYPMWNQDINYGGIGLVLEDGDGKKGRKVKVEKLDDVIKKIITKERTLDVIKIDAESSEWPILLTSYSIDLARVIMGEYHEIGGDWDHHDPASVGLILEKYDIHVLRKYLRGLGFPNFEHNRYHELNIGHFWAWK